MKHRLAKHQIKTKGYFQQTNAWLPPLPISELTPITQTFLIKQVDANVSPVIIARAFLPVIDVVILRINTIKQNIALTLKAPRKKCI